MNGYRREANIIVAFHFVIAEKRDSLHLFKHRGEAMLRKHLRSCELFKRKPNKQYHTNNQG